MKRRQRLSDVSLTDVRNGEVSSRLCEPTKTLALCLPQTDDVRCEYARSLASMMLTLGNIDAGMKNINLVYGAGTILPHVRQQIAEHAIYEQHATHLLWIDSDHSFPKNTAHRLLAHGRPFIGINATTRRMPVRATALKKEGEPLKTTRHSKGLEAVWRVGFGIALIEARVFLAMSKPWFMIEYIDKDDERVFRGEDFYFCEKAKAAGFQPVVDHDLSKETTHVGSVGFNILGLED